MKSEIRTRILLIGILTMAYRLMAADSVPAALNVSGLTLQPDGTFRAVVGGEGAAGRVRVMRPIEGPFVPQVSAGFGAVPAPKSAGVELARMSDEELGDFCLARQERLVYSLRRLESLRLSLGILDRRFSDARKRGIVTPELNRETEELRRGLLEEQATRKEEFRLIKPDLEMGLLEQRRRGMATRDLPALLGEAELR